MKRLMFFLLFALFSLSSKLVSGEGLPISNVPYYETEFNDSDSYKSERAVLDVYCPGESTTPKPTLVWFHGGGLTRGNNTCLPRLKNQGIVCVSANYRLYPKVNPPGFIQDAAAAVAWVFNNIENYGGRSELIFVSGHSAGGYLASMLGLDKRWLRKLEIDSDQIAGVIPLSGHTITHFTIRKHRGIANTQPIVDEFAPLFHVRANAPPFLLITGDRERELLGRYEENAYLMRMLLVSGHEQVRLYELEGYGHRMVEPAIPLVLAEIKRVKSAKGF
ncbi:MAG: alpha/beta hydrolase [Candidatus Azotimanducaceae bacterium]